MVGKIPLRPALSCGRRAARPFVSLVTLVLAGSVALTACGGDDGAKSDGAPDAQNTAAGATLQGQWPLTGLPARGDVPKHPVMVVKIDNTASSRPQVGLSKADLVTEELVEGGSTRLAVFYYSHVPGRVGPVRSMRASDIGIIKPADAALVASGGAPQTVRRLKAAGVKVYSEGAPGYSRDSSRSAPYNLFMQLPTLAKTLSSSGRPDDYFSWGDQKQFPKGQRARGISAMFSGGHTTSWAYRKGGYVNLNSNAAGNDQFRPDTVLVLRVRVGDAGYKDPAGNPVPETKFTGTGQAMVFHDGSVVRATWAKRGLDAPVTLRTKSGELSLPPGRVWMELVPQNGGNVVVKK